MKKLLRDLFKNSLQKGFTLIELLVVIAVLGVLAAIVLLAVNPGEQLARARDTSRISAVTQVGRTLQAFFTAQNATYPTQCPALPGTGCDWMLPMVTSSDLKTRPANAGFSAGAPATNCGTRFQEVFAGVGNGNAGGYCYQATATDAIAYARLESALNNNRCTGVGVVAWSVFSTADARSGVVCSSTEPAPGVQTFAP